MIWETQLSCSFLLLFGNKQASSTYPVPSSPHTTSPSPIYSAFFPLAFSTRPLAIRSMMLSRSLSSFNLVMTTLEGWMAMGTDCPFDFSRTSRSMCTRYLRRYTEITLPSRPLFVPRVTVTSSSLRMGMARTWEPCSEVRPVWGGELERYVAKGKGRNGGLTLCFSRRSLLKGALIITRRTLDGALKCAFRDFLREEWRARLRLLVSVHVAIALPEEVDLHVLIFVILTVVAMSMEIVVTTLGGERYIFENFQLWALRNDTSSFWEGYANSRLIGQLISIFYSLSSFIFTCLLGQTLYTGWRSSFEVSNAPFAFDVAQPKWYRLLRYLSMLSPYFPVTKSVLR